MARPVTPNEAPAKESNGHATGNGHSGNGHGTGAKRTGYHQLKAGEQPTWKGLSIERRYTPLGTDPYDTVEWESRQAGITNEHAKTVFEQNNPVVPKSRAQLANPETASK